MYMDIYSLYTRFDPQTQINLVPHGAHVAPCGYHVGTDGRRGAHRKRNRSSVGQKHVTGAPKVFIGTHQPPGIGIPPWRQNSKLTLSYDFVMPEVQH